MANLSNFHHPYDDATDFCDLFDNFRYGKLNLSIIHLLEVLYSWANEWLLGTVSVTLTSYVLSKCSCNHSKWQGRRGGT